MNMPHKYKNYLSLLGGFLLIFSLGSQAQARRHRNKPRKTSKVTITLLMRLGDSSPKYWTEDLTSAAKAATAERRTLRWRAAPKVSLDETRTLLGCRAWDADCIAQIGQTLGVRKVVYVDMKGPAQGSQSLRIFQVDVKHPKKAQQLSLVIPDRKVMGLTLAQAYVRAAILNQELTSLVVTSQPDRAEVLLNGAVVGHTPLIQMTHFAPGQYKLIMRRYGYQDLQRNFEAQKGRIAIISGTLKAQPAIASKPVAKATAKTTAKATDSTKSQVPAHEFIAAATQAESGTVSGETTESSADWQTPAAWSSIGIGGFLLAGAGVVGVLHIMNFSELDGSLDDGRRVSSLTEDEYKEKKALLWPMLGGSLGLAAAGLLGTGLGTGLMLWPQEKSENSSTANLQKQR